MTANPGDWSRPAPPVRVLAVARHVPPAGGPGVQRTLAFLRGLADAGMQADLVAPTADELRALGDFPADPTLSAALPATVRMRRTAGIEPWRLRRALGVLLGRRAAGRLLDWALQPDTGVTWTRPVGAMASVVAGTTGVDAVWATGPPFSAVAAGLHAARRAEVPLVADLRDPWGDLPYRTWPGRGAHDRTLRVEAETLRAAAAVVTVTPGQRTDLLDRLALDPAQVAVLPNGFDPRLFPPPADGARAARAEGAANPGADGVRIVHVGHFYARPEARAGGPLARLARRMEHAPRPLDRTPHSPVPTLRALARLGADADDVTVELIGHLSDAERDAVREAGFPRVEMPGYLPHAEAAARLRRAHVVLLPLSRPRDGERFYWVPGKTYEALGARVPVLGLVPEGDCRDLLAGAGVLAAPDPERIADPEAIAEVLADLLPRVRAGDVPAPREDVVRWFERPALSAAQARLVECVARTGAPPDDLVADRPDDPAGPWGVFPPTREPAAEAPCASS